MLLSAQIKLYDLFHTLRALCVHIAGVTKLIVEMDVQYIKGMLKNPDMQPNAAINRWLIVAILIDFERKHPHSCQQTSRSLQLILM
jgi:hypothetical protein